jgi:hypothetical protein
MAPFVVAAIVAASLFTTGSVVRPQDPVLGTALQGAGLGVAVGGAVGAAVGVPSALATGFGATTAGGLVTGTAVVGAGLGAGAGYLVQTRDPSLISKPEAVISSVVPAHRRVAHRKVAAVH